VFRVPNGVAHCAQVNVFQLNVIVAQINHFTRHCVGICLLCLSLSSRLPRLPCLPCLPSFFFFLASHNGGTIRKLGGVVIAIARTLGVRALDCADSGQSRIQFGVFVYHVGMAAPSLLQRCLRNHDVVNGDRVVFMAAVAAIIHDAIGFGQTNVIHISTIGTEMHCCGCGCCCCCWLLTLTLFLVLYMNYCEIV